jgi:hypothetical protein
MRGAPIGIPAARFGGAEPSRASPWCSRYSSMKKRVETAIFVALLCAVAWVGYRLVMSKVEIDIYRDRLEDLSGEYESLRGMYNEAVAKTAVTELVVKDGRLSVAIRTIQGVERTIETPFDPKREIFCDYVVIDGRMWIRRVYDATTPPAQGLYIDNSLQEIDWSASTARYGTTVYRPIDEGRWVVTVTGDGSLGLGKVKDDAKVVLSGPPPVRDYDQIEKEITRSVSDVTIADIVKRVAAEGK